jgi:septal ring factor EnvC (AmiA/AmiB activator)
MVYIFFQEVNEKAAPQDCFFISIKPNLSGTVYFPEPDFKTRKKLNMKTKQIVKAFALTGLFFIAFSIDNTVDAQRRSGVRDRIEDIRDRREDVRDRREDIRDRREDIRDRREDRRDAMHQGGVLDRREDIRDRREDVRDRREDVRDRREDIRDRREDRRDRRF